MNYFIYYTFLVYISKSHNSNLYILVYLLKTYDRPHQFLINFIRTFAFVTRYFLREAYFEMTAQNFVWRLKVWMNQHISLNLDHPPLFYFSAKKCYTTQNNVFNNLNFPVVFIYVVLKARVGLEMNSSTCLILTTYKM